MQKKPKIIINGQELESLQNLTPELRNVLKDENNNNIPDILESGVFKFLIGGNLASLTQANKTMQKFIVDGKEFTSLKQMSPEIQQRIKNKLRELEHRNPQAAQIIKGLTGGKTTPLSELKSNTPPRSQILGAGRPPNQPGGPIGLPGVKEDYRSKIILFIIIVAAILWLISEYGDKLF